jgi:hypothetical protein
MRLRDMKGTERVSPPSPHGFPVEGRPNSDLLRELQWYLETFLDYPFPPETDHAEPVLKGLTKAVGRANVRSTLRQSLRREDVRSRDLG